MSITEKVLVLCVLAKVIVTFLVSYFAAHLTSVMVSVFAAILPTVWLWN
jgi:hypothetical protein